MDDKFVLNTFLVLYNRETKCVFVAVAKNKLIRWTSTIRRKTRTIDNKSNIIQLSEPTLQ